MNNATIEWTQKAAKQLRGLPEQMKTRIYAAVSGLESWPHVHNVKSLVNREDYRLRVGDYRVIFNVNGECTLTIILIKEVKKRDERTY